MRAHILTTSPEIGGMLEAGLKTEGDKHHITLDSEVSTARRPIPLDIDLLIADLDHPCMPPKDMLRVLAQHPAAQQSHVVVLTSDCAIAARLQRDERWAAVMHSLRDLMHLYDVWFGLLQQGRGPCVP